MKKIVKYVLVIMVSIMMLGACSQENTSDNLSNNSNSSSTGVVGKWETPDGCVMEFKSGNIYENNSVCGTYYGNDIEGELSLFLGNGKEIEFYYTVSGNNMTWTEKEEPHAKEYLTRK